ncbi:DEAD/DEAH box helicase family protein [Mucilaginibacter sabulilitoris]|uniref:DEAD/DEAH box helicase family protein n=1 Tax=Mucilaginibacter sabulilitoris TaxID=1173583 RepID=A0ABZ0TG98_9SPHI|nr:DEAD/DEAH box helicase family protein [Mucilaginibacter sabulilitoris]WPU91831.1 DEAD/DEAH box helicase family protein [Mucilaginibacter sabulilitoris]
MRHLSYTLYDYQQALVKDLAVASKQHTHVIGQSPGGTGKTKTFVYIGTQVCNRGGVTLILTERKNVFNQNLNEAGAVGINDESPKFVHIAEGGFYVAMTQTLERRNLIIEQFNRLTCNFYIIIDECHSGRYSNVLRRLTTGKRLGFTATPDFRYAKHLPEFYNDCVTTHPVQWFIDKNILCDYQHIQRKSGKGTDKLEKKAGDFTATSQRKFFGTDTHYQELFNDLREYPFNKCMLFCASIEHAEEVFEVMVSAGFSCSINHSKRDDSVYQVAKFDKLHETNIIISVGGMTTGYDYPEVDLIVLYRATTSLIIYLQMLFRGDRKKEGMFFRCLDYGSNFDRHGAYFADHDWKEMWNKKEKNRSKEDAAAMTTCPHCESMIAASAKKCKFCGFVMPEKPRPVEPGIAEDVTKRFDALAGKRVSELTPKELSLFANLRNKKMFAIRVAKAQEQLNPGFLIDFAASMGYKSGWLDHQPIPQERIEFSDIILR